MNQTGTPMILAGLGLGAACAAICCSVPLLVLALPGLVLLLGAAGDSMEVGLLAALVMGALTVGGGLIWRRRSGRCSRRWACNCGCR